MSENVEWMLVKRTADNGIGYYKTAIADKWARKGIAKVYLLEDPPELVDIETGKSNGGDDDE
jgi:hypothetical protein